MHSGVRRFVDLLRHGALLPCTALLMALVRAATDAETDLFWMAREGQQVLAGGGFVHADRWSWAPVPGNFAPTSPLWEILAGLAWHLGRPGLIALTVVTLFLCALGLAWVARSLGAATPAVAIALLLSLAIEPPSWTGRAALPAVVLLLVALAAFHRLLPKLAATSLPTALAKVSLGSFAVAWVGIGLHASWTAYSLCVAAGFAWLAVGHGRRGGALAVAGGAAAIVGASTGPLGPAVWQQVGRVASAGRGVITEWSPPGSLGSAALGAYLAGWLLLLLSLRALRGGGSGRSLLALLIGMALAAQVAGATAERFSFLAMSIAMPAMAVTLSSGLPPRLTARLEHRLGERLHEAYWRNVLTALAVTCLPLAIVFAPRAYAVLEAPALTSLPQHCRLFSDDGTGSVAVLVRPDLQPWIDGRLDYWGPARMVADRDLLLRAHAGTLVPAGAQCVAMPTGRYPALSRALDASAAWRSMTRSGPIRAWARR